MLKKINVKNLKKIALDAKKYLFSPDLIPLVYFDEIKNVGDLISPYLVEKISMRKTYCARTGVFPRIIGVGSILGSATKNADIWGTGLMSPEHGPIEVNGSLIHAVRGKNTRDYLFNKHNITRDIPLGDPAILMPRFYNPASLTKNRVGFIPHYVDHKKVTEIVAQIDPSILVIDVRQEPESFIDELLCCTHIMSSSLHGLILADAYRIPNVWVCLGNNIAGGDWKYFDYFSTTTQPIRRKYLINSAANIYSLLSNLDKHFISSEFSLSEFDLLNSFPRNFIRE